jgi:hypothetical protein
MDSAAFYLVTLQLPGHYSISKKVYPFSLMKCYFISGKQKVNVTSSHTTNEMMLNALLNTLVVIRPKNQCNKHSQSSVQQNTMVLICPEIITN